MKLVVLTPMEGEFDALATALTAQGLEGVEQTIGRLKGIAYAGGSLILAQGGHGKARFGVRTQHVIDHLSDVGLVVCAGAAGGLSSALSVGDVVVATGTVEHDYRERFVSRPLPHFEGHEPSRAALQDAALSLGGANKLHFGLIASGDEDIVEPSRANELHQSTGALAVAWEGAGGAKACEFSNMPFLEIRGITDMSNDGSLANLKMNLPSAMTNVAVVLGRLTEIVSRR